MVTAARARACSIAPVTCSCSPAPPVRSRHRSATLGGLALRASGLAGLSELRTGVDHLVAGDALGAVL